MCGIAGFCDFSKKSDLQSLINMTNVLSHRGPDDSGYSFYEGDWCQVGLGHRRLSIVDLTKHGHQPMAFEHLEIVYNGEVYNFREIKAELQKYHYVFDSDSDTEVILKAFDKWGMKAVDRFIGMFAIAIFDKKNQNIVFIRDRGGIKPFYYYFKDGLFMFASELKSFHQHSAFSKELDLDSLAMFLQYGYIMQPASIFKYTKKLKSAHYLSLDLKTKRIEEIPYWDVLTTYKQPKLDISYAEATSHLETLLISAFEYRMVADVPVGVFLSGGYDSSIVTALLQAERTSKLKTFSIGFDDPHFDEAKFANNVAEYLGTDHTEYYCTKDDIRQILPQLPEIYDEPFGDSSAIPTTLVSKLAREQVSVALSADGSDEIFGGYDKYNIMLRNQEMIGKIKATNVSYFLNLFLVGTKPIISTFFDDSNSNRKLQKLQNLLNNYSLRNIFKYGNQHLTDQDVRRLIKYPIRDCIEQSYTDEDILDVKNSLDVFMALDYKTYLTDDILVKVDRATMHHSLEGREPFMDHRIIEFASRLPNDFKLNGNNGKRILKDITHKYIPKAIMDRPKKGFGVPLQKWMKDDLLIYVNEYLDAQFLANQNIFNIPLILKLKKSFITGKDYDFNQLWYILCFQMWYKKWMM